MRIVCSAGLVFFPLLVSAPSCLDFCGCLVFWGIVSSDFGARVVIALTTGCTIIPHLLICFILVI
jgi:hypothetical protein